MDIEKQKQEFREAYEWMLRVQAALLFTEYTVEVTHQYTPENKHEYDLDGFTAHIAIHADQEMDADRRILLVAEWCPWLGYDKFLSEKARIEGFLLGRGFREI